MSINAEVDVIDFLAAEQLKVLLTPSPRANYASAWHGHIAFASWLVSATKPKFIVELGTHFGVSYAAFCQAVKDLNLDTKCFAIDTWEGDSHSGLYDKNVYEDLNYFNTKNFSKFSTLIKEVFDNAVDLFDDKSIDLLHIDGLHTYEAVKTDFYNWVPKLSNKAVVIFHDTEVRVQDFGVHRFWSEISREYPSFNFKHSAGLGILAYGDSVPRPVLDLCRKSNLEAAILERRFELLSKIVHMLGGRVERSQDQENYAKPNNIALNCAASQSSHYGTPAPTPQGAINGHKTGGFGFHTAYEQGAWWQVDLGKENRLTEIVIYNRIDPFCRERAASLEIIISIDSVEWKSVYLHNGEYFGGVDGYPLVVNLNLCVARFVKIQLREANFLHLDEVEIYS